jgi:hypothetical protein
MKVLVTLQTGRGLIGSCFVTNLMDGLAIKRVEQGLAEFETFEVS